jgi:glycosyltransferase involved in cell wall biosynthesis
MSRDAASVPLRIAMISYYLPSESKIGVGYQVHELANEFARRGHQVDVFSPCAPVQGALYGHVHLPMTGSLRTFRFALVMRRQDLSSYDVLHAHGEDYWMWRRRVPMHVRTLHGSCFEEAIHIQGLGQKLRMVMLGLTEVLASLVADRTVLISPQTRRWTPWVRTVIPNGVDAARFAPDGTPRSSDPTVLFVGTWRQRKRGSDLARIFAEEVRPRVPRARLRMVTQDAPADVPDGVDALGRLSDDELAHEYRSAWVFCLPSSYEGFGIPYAEAMTAGVPVVATPNVGARYVTDDSRYGVLAELDELGGELVALLRDEGWRERLGAASLDRAKEFDLRSVADRYEDLYRTSRPRLS